MVSIIESRARAVDLITHNYYELLYAFHINRHNYRKGKTDGVGIFQGFGHKLVFKLTKNLSVFKPVQ